MGEDKWEVLMPSCALQMEYARLCAAVGLLDEADPVRAATIRPDALSHAYVSASD